MRFYLRRTVVTRSFILYKFGDESALKIVLQKHRRTAGRVIIDLTVESYLDKAIKITEEEYEFFKENKWILFI